MLTGAWETKQTYERPGGHEADRKVCEWTRGRREAKAIEKKILVAMRLRETPVPIPNTTVKTQAADGTALETMWESRWLPE